MQTGPANQRDDAKLEDLLEAFPVLTDGDAARTVHVLPAVLLGDRGYGFAYLIALVVLFGIVPLLSPRGKDKPHGSGLGKVRWVVERTLAWVGQARRLKVRYEVSIAMHRAFHYLQLARICCKVLNRDF